MRTHALTYANVLTRTTYMHTHTDNKHADTHTRTTPSHTRTTYMQTHTRTTPSHSRTTSMHTHIQTLTHPQFGENTDVQDTRQTPLHRQTYTDTPDTQHAETNTAMHTAEICLHLNRCVIFLCCLICGKMSLYTVYDELFYLVQLTSSMRSDMPLTSDVVLLASLHTLRDVRRTQTHTRSAQTYKFIHTVTLVFCVTHSRLVKTEVRPGLKTDQIS